MPDISELEGLPKGGLDKTYDWEFPGCEMHNIAEHLRVGLSPAARLSAEMIMLTMVIYLITVSTTYYRQELST